MPSKGDLLPTQKASKKNIDSLHKKRDEILQSLSSKLDSNSKLIEIGDITTTLSLDTSTALFKNDSVFISQVIADRNSSPHLTISGIGGISELQNPVQAGGNFSAVATFRLGDYKRIKRNSQWLDPAFLYMAFNTRTGSSADSDQISKTFLFPDISKRDFVIGSYLNFFHAKNSWCIDPTIEFSLNRYKITQDSISNGFKSESVLVGIRISKSQLFGKDSSFEAGFVLFPYYNIINVQPKYFTSYNAIIKGNNLPPTIHTIGLQAILQLSKVMLFANMKYILNTGSNLNVDDLKGFTYTIGTLIGVDLLKFRLTGS